MLKRIAFSSIIFLCAAHVHACSVPVFRYALERWESAPYVATVFYRGALGGADKSVVDSLRQAGEATNATANIRVRTVNLDSPVDSKTESRESKIMAKLWAAQKNATLPWVVMQYPDMNDDLEPMWAGTLSSMRLEQWTSSPSRIQIAKNLAAGDSVVWALVQTGDPAKDAAAMQTLKTELAKLEPIIALPKDDDNLGGPTVRLRSELPLKIAFSVVPVLRTDPAEVMFVAMLMGIDKRFRNSANPVAFPIFGRGRALAGLTGKDLSESTIEEATTFLTGACSCQLKELNPGVDMLFDTDWEGILEASHYVEKSAQTVTKAPISEPKHVVKKAPELVALPAPVKMIEHDIVERASSYRLLIVAGVVLSGALMLGAGIWLLKSKTKN
ncbi:MAG: hypothetical protein WCT04_04245 [Planctomycetota bacterium]